MIPLASVMYALVKEYTNKRLVEKDIPYEKLNPEPVQIQSHFQQNRARKERIRIAKMRKKWKELHNKSKK
jgi:predicted  nucleic acid-binding Zn-ribbon protein